MPKRVARRLVSLGLIAFAISCAPATEPQTPSESTSTAPVTPRAPKELAPLPGDSIAVFRNQRACALGSDSSVYCWGQNRDGELGDGSRVTRPTPVQVKGVKGAKGVALGSAYSCALLEDGRVACWGRKPWAKRMDHPRDVEFTPGELKFSQLSAGWEQLCGVTTDGGVACLGSHRFPMGDSNRKPWERAKEWEQLPGLNDVVQIQTVSMGSCVLHKGGTVSCWGFATHDDEKTKELLAVPGIEDAVRLGRSTLGWPCALLEDGSGVCWDNGVHKSGTEVEDKLVDFPLASAGEVVSEFAYAANARCARLKDGRVTCSGSNKGSLIGAQTPGYSASPTEVPDFRVTKITQLTPYRICGTLKSGEPKCVQLAPVDHDQIPSGTLYAAGTQYGCYVEGKDVYCAGTNWAGQLGAEPGPKSAVVKHEGVGTVKKLAVSLYNACALLETGKVLCWGKAGRGVPLEAKDGKQWVAPTVVEGLPKAVDLALGSDGLCVLEASKKVSCVGAKHSGFTAVHGFRGVKSFVAAMSAGCLTVDDDEVLCWGSAPIRPKREGEPFSQRNTPAEVGLDHVAELGAAGMNACALTRSGEVHCWGRGDKGQTGSGTPEDSLKPVKVLEDVEQLEVSHNLSCALTKAGKTMCWGYAAPGAGPLEYEEPVVVSVP